MSALETATVQRTSYYSIVWRELKKDRLALLGLWAVLGLVAAAVGAPLVSQDQPFLYVESGHWSSPWLRGLFDRLVFESSVDIFFNLLLVLAPAYALVRFVLARVLGQGLAAREKRLAQGFGIGFVALFLAVTPATLGGAENPLHYSHQVENYRAKVAAARAAHRDVHAIFPLHHYSYRETNPAESLVPPNGEHWLGTDTEGRDVFARMLYGTRISLSIGVVAVALYVFLGVVVGALAGYFGGWVDSALSRLIEVMICFPTFFLILTLAALIRERSIFHVMFIIGITSWTGVARLVRAEFLKHKGLEYAQAARALGIPVRRIIFGHILPNASAPVLVSATFGIASAILVESSLSFLGIGDPTVASWGETLNAGRVDNRLWLILAPGFAIFFVVTVFNLVGEGLRDALDPKLRR
ncbi:MAG TPA: ABC transporter permease [Polyangiaceae bacterium]|nr:ABC transporter permease [Polyangiaceae bacterium]